MRIARRKLGDVPRNIGIRPAPHKFCTAGNRHSDSTLWQQRQNRP